MAFIKKQQAASGEPQTPSEVKAAINGQVRAALQESGLPSKVTLFLPVKQSNESVLTVRLDSMADSVRDQVLSMLEEHKVRHEIADDIRYDAAVEYVGQLSVKIDPKTKRLENRVIYYANRQAATHPTLDAVTISGTLEAPMIDFQADEATAKAYFEAKQKAEKASK